MTFLTPRQVGESDFPYPKACGESDFPSLQTGGEISFHFFITFCLRTEAKSKKPSNKKLSTYQTE